jgi:hypothetical protein
VFYLIQFQLIVFIFYLFFIVQLFLSFVFFLHINLFLTCLKKKTNEM